MNDPQFLSLLVFVGAACSLITVLLCYRVWGAKADAWDDLVEDNEKFGPPTCPTDPV